MKRSSPLYYKENLTWAAKPDIYKKAKELRKSMTVAEEFLLSSEEADNRN